MRQHILKLTLGLLALTGMFLALAASVQAAPNRVERSLTIRLISTVAGGRFVDRPPMGRTNKGDVTYVRSVLRNGVAQFGRPKGVVVGSDYAVLTFLTARTALVRASVKLPGGTLRLRGKFDVTRTSGVLSVVGGARAFADARGTCWVRDLQGRSINVYRLSL